MKENKITPLQLAGVVPVAKKIILDRKEDYQLKSDNSYVYTSDIFPADRVARLVGYIWADKKVKVKVLQYKNSEGSGKFYATEFYVNEDNNVNGLCDGFDILSIAEFARIRIENEDSNNTNIDFVLYGVTY